MSQTSKGCVEIHSDSRFPFDRRMVRSAISGLLAQYGMADQAVIIDVSVVGDRKMRMLNRAFRRIDESTDVLAFPTEDLSLKPDGMIHLGDVVMSYPYARRVAIQMNRMIDAILVERAIHGVKHLLGEHHE